MPSPLAVAFGFVTVAILLAAVVGAIERREKFPFAAGVVLLVSGPLLVGALSFPSVLGGIIALIGFVAIVASTVPLLRQSPTSS